MHPEIVQVGAGDCPLCGMALDPLVPTVADGESPELIEMMRRLKVGAALTVPLVAVAMGSMLPGAQWLDGAPFRWLQGALAAVVVFWPGYPLLDRALASVRHRAPNMFTLIGVGVMAALGFSVVTLIAPGLIPTNGHGHGGPPLYFESASVIVVLVLVGQVLELRARGRAGDALRALASLVPATAHVLRGDGSEQEVGISQLQVGDRVRLRPGERVAADGIIVEGETSIDESMVTGESLPVVKASGARAIAGTLNCDGSVVVQIEKLGEHTLVARIVKLVLDAQRSRAPVQRLVDRVSSFFVPAVFVVAAATLLVWLAAGASLATALVHAVSVLIVACPCALGLATPMSIVVGTGRGATHGVLIRDAEALERMASVDTIVFDKTGTLTQGRPTVRVARALGGMEAPELMYFAASVEVASEHPIARAVVAWANAGGVTPGHPSEFRAIPGQGATAVVDGHHVKVCSWPALSDGERDVMQSKELLSLRDQGLTLAFVILNGKVCGVLGLADEVKTTSVEAVAMLREEGIRLVMATGDNPEAAGRVAAALGLDEVCAELSPAGKAELVSRLRHEGRRVAMAGDGVNDAPALAVAEVGVAMGGGTDVALETAAITLVKGDLRALVRARRLSRATLWNIRENLFFAFVYNLLGVPVASGLLVPFFGIALSPMLAAAAMSLSSLCVITNALRLRRVEI